MVRSLRAIGSPYRASEETDDVSAEATLRRCIGIAGGLARSLGSGIGEAVWKVLK